MASRTGPTDGAVGAPEADGAPRTVRADVVVVGAGPAGAVLSYLLARSGVDVALLERAGTFEREYRGFGWSPGVVELFDRMDLLSDVLELAHETVRRGTVVLYGTRFQIFDFETLPTPHPYALLMEQPALLELLVDRASEYDGFSFRPSTTVEDLVTEDGRVVGVRAHDRAADERVTVRGRTVIGADGRYSRVRSAAGIDAGLYDPALDLVWFKVPAGVVDRSAQLRLDRGGLVLYFGLGADQLQIGWPIVADTYPALREDGIAAFRRRVAGVAPGLGPVLAEHLDGFEECTLLEVAPGVAPEWVRDGLALIGDAAHVASPIGGQGNPLAVADAAVAHDVLCAGLERTDGVLPASALVPLEARRRADVERTIRLQRRAERAVLWYLRHGEHVPPALVRGLARGVASVAPRSARVRRGLERFALGAGEVPVARERFMD